MGGLKLDMNDLTPPPSAPYGALSSFPPAADPMASIVDVPKPPRLPQDPHGGHG